MKKSTYLPVLAAMLIAVVVCIVAISSFEGISEVNAQTPAMVQDKGSSPQEAINIVKGLNNAFIAIAEKTNPSVVTIFTDKVVKQRNPYASPYSDPFGGFFGRYLPEREQRLQGMGSGVIVSEDGYILTNNHVVREADAIKVMLLNGKKVDVKVIGSDAQTDIAVLKIEEDNLSAIELGNSDHLHIGEWVLAIGSPLSEHLAHTVTAGIVSAKGRSNVGLADYEDFIQTDAAINPGNSGGALINLDGKLVGINTAIVSQSGGFQGIGFAVPVNMARRVMESLIKEGRMVRGWLGILIQGIDENLAKALNVPPGGGILVTDVPENSPAAKAGIKPGDILLEINGRKVQSVAQLRNEIASRAPGAEVKMLISREGKKINIPVVLGELPDQPLKPARQENIFDKLGFTLQPLDAQLAAALGLDPDEKGLVVTDISPNSPAYRSSLRIGDLVKEVNRTPVTTIGEFSQIISQSKTGDTLLIHLKRQGNHFFAAFELP